ncbi:MAG: sigma-70 family RNA polymerase sigma factor [Verrucomicrobiales bacterium]|nr:sigma-70 family RNA polymerase sigma factor [Verrucomicrobiales bacterium]
MAEALSHLTDEELAHRAQAGEVGAFETLVERFEARIYRFALHWCGREADAREVTQDTFVAAYLHLNRFDSAHAFVTWLFTIARRKCIDHARRAPVVGAEPIGEEADTDDPFELMARREACDDLWALARRVLPATQFQTLWLHYVEDLSVRDVARVTGKTLPHVKVLLFRARRTLGRELRVRSALEGASAPAPSGPAVAVSGLIKPTP